MVKLDTDQQAFLNKIDMALESPRCNSFRRPFLKSIRSLVAHGGRMSESQARCAALLINDAPPDVGAANDNGTAVLSTAGGPFAKSRKP